MEGNMSIQFDGQQTDERVLYVITPHSFSKYIAIIRLLLLALFFFVVLQLIATVEQPFAGVLRISSFLVSIVLFGVGYWWNDVVYKKSKSYITDRRIIRFEVMTPFFTTKRTLFWNEALKAKGYTQNIFWKMLNIGIIKVEPHLTENEDVCITDVYMYDDVANYIDKILFTFKNKTTEVANIKPFVPKPKGQRDISAS